MTDTSSPAAVPAQAAAPSDAALLDRARTALAIGDVDGYMALAGDASGLTDPHRRYVTRRRLVELALGASRQRPDDARLKLAALHCALEALSGDPAEPVLLNLGGVAFFQAGSLKGAEALLRAAESLDPDVVNLASNLRAVAGLRRRRQALKPPPAIAAKVAAHERRAVQLAAQARPADAATISLCMIVRDEEATLGRALASARGVVDEIVVVDTGSQDRTVEIAREHGARVLEHVWDDDFSAARNVGVEAATGDWILYLDADEALVAEDAPKLRELVRRTWREGFLLEIVNRAGGGRGESVLSTDILRLFRNRPEHRFEGIVHEGVLHCLPGDAPERVETAGVRIVHEGYLDDVRAAKDKSRRNLELLERQLREGEPTAYLQFNLGTEHLATGDLERALEHFTPAWRLLLAERDPASATFGPALAARYAAALRATGRPADALAVATRGLELFDGFTDLVLEQALARLAQGDPDAAEPHLRRALALGDAPARFAALTGAGTFLPATALGELLVARGDAEEAVTLLADALADAPHHDPARVVLADALIGAGRFDAAAEAAAAVPADSPARADAAARETLARAAAGAPGELPADVLPLLARTLDARLKVTDVDGFVALVPLVDRVAGLSPRARRELRACLYFDHGFLDSAADEWAAACQEHGPDVEALTGLARVAAAAGNDADAAVFAEGARELADAAVNA